MGTDGSGSTAEGGGQEIAAEAAILSCGGLSFLLGYFSTVEAGEATGGHSGWQRAFLPLGNKDKTGSKRELFSSTVESNSTASGEQRPRDGGNAGGSATSGSSSRHSASRGGADQAGRPGQ